MKKVECQMCSCAVNEGETWCQRCLCHYQKQMNGIFNDTGAVPFVTAEELLREV